jgi:hypothetical protein
MNNYKWNKKKLLTKKTRFKVSPGLMGSKKLLGAVNHPAQRAYIVKTATSE